MGGCLEQLADEVRFDIPPSRRAAIKRPIIAIMRGRSEVGAAFFISPRVAITVAHNLLSTNTSLIKTVTCAHPDGDRRAYELDVVAYDIALDFAVLRLQAHARPSTHHLPTSSDIECHSGVFL